MMMPKRENPWDVESLYEFRYYNCPSCPYKQASKQDFICHAFDTHQESINFLSKIIDGSLDNILCPWDSNDYQRENIDISGDLKSEFDNNESTEEVSLVVVKNEITELSESEDIDYLDSMKDEDNILVDESIQYDEENSTDRKEDTQFIIMKNHSNHGENMCNLCGKTFSNKSYLIFHTSVDHAENNHVDKTVHKEQKDYKCASCNKSFSHKSSLKTHVTTVHNSQKDHKCDKCGKSFSRSGTLKNHIIEVHDGFKGTICESCGRSFSRPSRLKEHYQTIHEARRDFKCDSCVKSFKTLSHMKQHIHIVHEGNMDFKCESCGKPFSREDNLKRHISTVSPNYSFLYTFLHNIIYVICCYIW